MFIYASFSQNCGIFKKIPNKFSHRFVVFSGDEIYITVLFLIEFRLNQHVKFRVPMFHVTMTNVARYFTDLLI